MSVRYVRHSVLGACMQCCSSWVLKVFVPRILVFRLKAASIVNQMKGYGKNDGAEDKNQSIDGWMDEWESTEDNTLSVLHMALLPTGCWMFQFYFEGTREWNRCCQCTLLVGLWLARDGPQLGRLCCVTFLKIIFKFLYKLMGNKRMSASGTKKSMDIMNHGYNYIAWTMVRDEGSSSSPRTRW